MENCAWAAHIYQSGFLEDLSNEVKLGLSCWTVMWLQLPPSCARCGRSPGCCLLLWAGCELSPLAPGVPHSSDLTGIQYLCAGRSGLWYLFRCLRNQFLCFDARLGGGGNGQVDADTAGSDQCMWKTGRGIYMSWAPVCLWEWHHAAGVGKVGAQNCCFLLFCMQLFKGNKSKPLVCTLAIISCT